LSTSMDVKIFYEIVKFYESFLAKASVSN
jgi:hypothetical protein